MDKVEVQFLSYREIYCLKITETSSKHFGTYSMYFLNHM